VVPFVSGSINTRELLAVDSANNHGSLSCGGMSSRHAGCTKSLAHLFLLAVLVPKAEETVEAIRI